MDQPEEKKTPPNPGKPPLPPALGKKVGGVPKGPVPPRPQPFGSMGGGAPKPPLPPAGFPKPPSPMGGAPAPKPPMPPMGMPGAKPPMPPMGMPAAKPPMPGIPGMRAPGMPPAMPPAALPPAIETQISEAESAKSELENRISDLEKKLLEEREKVLLASLKSKEEEMVSAKVETSIKDIQDKLRREKKEQELEESRRKAENRVAEMERRIAEEREAWVATLKTQLNTRDQNTQEMESHFSTRLKDLEYRWSQEKTSLENAIRDKDSEITRVKHESAIKAEQEKTFWEDRLRALIGERDKIERDLERAQDRYEQEKEHASLERQSFRDQIARLESSLRFMEEQGRSERAAVNRDHDSQINLLKQQMAMDKENFDKQSLNLHQQLQTAHVEHREKAAQLQAINEQLAAARAQIGQFEFRLNEKEKQALNSASEVADLRKQLELHRTDGERVKLWESKYTMAARELEEAKARIMTLEREISGLNHELNRVRNSVKEEVSRGIGDAESRIRTLQGRLDWYDNNVKREYDNAREKVREEFEALEKQLKHAEQVAAQYKDAKENAENLQNEKQSLSSELDQMRSEWKQNQWEMEARLKEVSDQLESEKFEHQQAERARTNLEQELRQRSEALEQHQSVLGQRQRESDQYIEKLKDVERRLAHEHERAAEMETQINDYKNMLHGKGIKPTQEIEAELAEKNAALEKMRENIARLTAQVLEGEKKDDLFQEKERVFKQMLAGKEDLVNEFKSRALALDRKLEEVRQEVERVKSQHRGEIENLMKNQKDILEQERAQRKQELEQERVKKAQEMEQLLKKKEEEMRRALTEAASNVPEGPNVKELELQVRQQVEMESVDRQREIESSFEGKLAAFKEEKKKEFDKIKWETESLKEELKRARESRLQIEREAQELLQQAEDHYRQELSKKTFEMQNEDKKNKGLFSTLGRWLDTPVIDTSKKKPEGEEE